MLKYCASKNASLKKLQILKQALSLRHILGSCLKSCAISSILLQKYPFLETLYIRILLYTIYWFKKRFEARRCQTIYWTIWNDNSSTLSSYVTIARRTKPNLSNFSKKSFSFQLTEFYNLLPSFYFFIFITKMSFSIHKNIYLLF